VTFNRIIQIPADVVQLPLPRPDQDTIAGVADVTIALALGVYVLRHLWASQVRSHNDDQELLEHLIANQFELQKLLITLISELRSKGGP
jgi:hypothetical protein